MGKGFGPVRISGCRVDEERHWQGKKVWIMAKPIDMAKDLEVFDLPLAHIDIDVAPWGDKKPIENFAYHMKRVQHSDLKHPVIMSQSGFIMNGWHRVVKAMLEGRESVKAVRFERNPPQCFTETG